MGNQEKNSEMLQGRVEDKSSSTKEFMLGALIGGMVGAATALFLAPKSGREIRSNLQDLKDIVISKGNEMVTVAKEKTTILSKTINQSDELMNKDSDFREKEEQSPEIKYVPIEPFISSHEELQKKLLEAEKALEEQEQRIKG
ncbi:MAG TPA: YtxH domain-containing protein [Pseudoneobacillus sp.]|nr:YtxH domain-containing protein [Pseudoneobacillus sp.]